MPINQYGQPVGEALGDWTPPSGVPEPRTLEGRTVTVEPLDLDRHVDALYRVLSDAPPSLWTYMSFGPFEEPSALAGTLQVMVDDPSWQPYAILVDGAPAGFAAYLRIQPRDGVVEIGSITFSPALQRTTPATESLYLMIRNVFEQGYRRCEWKCDDLNAPSRVAATRLGFAYEGTFRRATHYKGRNRDTAWYAITDVEWRDLEQSFATWLDPQNFDENGDQKTRLREDTRP
jgi:RimJ/RimL family protein N-acetyltransferase